MALTQINQIGLATTNYGTSGQFLQTNGSNVMSWANASATGGSNGQIQYNSSGSLAGGANTTVTSTGDIQLSSYTSVSFTDYAGGAVGSTLAGVAYGNGRFVVAGVNGTIWNSSNNGATWTQATINSSGNWSFPFNGLTGGGMTYSPAGPNGTFVVAGSTSNANIPPVRVSTDNGATWTVPGTGNANLVGNFRAAAYQMFSANTTAGSGTFVVVGSNSANANAGALAYTSNALGNWTAVTTNISTGSTLNDVTFSPYTANNGVWVAVGANGNIKYSNTANSGAPASWSNASFPNTNVTFNRVAAGIDTAGNSVYVVAGTIAGGYSWVGYSSNINTSPSFTRVSNVSGPGNIDPTSVFSAVSFANFAGQIGFYGLSTDTKVYFSTNGAYWTQITSSFSIGSQPQNQAFGNNTYLITGQNEVVSATSAQGNISGLNGVLTGSLEVAGQIFGTGSMTGVINTAIPTSASSYGIPGQIAYNATSNNLYICVASNTWRKVNLSATIP